MFCATHVPLFDCALQTQNPNSLRFDIVLCAQHTYLSRPLPLSIPPYAHSVQQDKRTAFCVAGCTVLLVLKRERERGARGRDK